MYNEAVNTCLANVGGAETAWFSAPYWVREGSRADAAARFHVVVWSGRATPDLAASSPVVPVPLPLARQQCNNKRLKFEPLCRPCREAVRGGRVGTSIPTGVAEQPHYIVTYVIYDRRLSDRHLCTG